MLAFVTNPRPQVSLTTFSDSSVPVVLIDWRFAHCCGWSFIFDSFAWFATLTATGWKKKHCVGATALLGGSEDVGPIRVSFEGTVRWRSQWRSPYAVSSHFAGGFLQKSMRHKSPKNISSEPSSSDGNGEGPSFCSWGELRQWYITSCKL